jgi:tetratricopeptide (TPR) repeat protein
VADLLERLKAALSDRYRIERELGSGGMAMVYLAQDLKHERQVAVKVLRPELAAALGPERFHQEIKIAANLTHPHILPLHDSGDADGFLYYVMPHIEGESLRDKLAKEGELPIGEAVRILRDVVDALSEAHDKGVVHRDIKPDNVLLAKHHAMVTDFGVAKAVSEATGAQKLTTDGVALGTPAYMSPEQAAADRHIDHRADIYAVGALAYELLTGRPPFTGATPQEVLAAHVTQAPDPVTKYRESVPPALEQLVMKCLEKKAADRWQSADELLPLLEVLATPSGGMTPTGTQPVAAIDYEAAAKRAHPVRVAALFGLAAVGVLAIVYVLVMQLGLPDWVFVSAVGLLVLALPITLLTGHHERQRALAQTTSASVTTPATGLRRWLRWRRAFVVGALAFAGLAVLATGYMVMRLLGVGPAGTLVTTGVLGERDRLIVADFENRTDDSTLGASVTEAFRIDLGQSPVLRLTDVSDVALVLQRMSRDPNSPLDRETALEVAVREGIKAVVVGEVGPVGGGFVLSARVLAAADGDQLLGLRETADGNTELIPAIDRLSAKLRERIGESLRTIRANEPLEQVTTASPDALRKYSQGIRAFDAGDYGRAIPLLEEAIGVDTAFAMAYRKLAVSLNNAFAGQSRQNWAAAKAFEHRDRLPDIERYLATAHYHYEVEWDPNEVRTNYLNVLDIQPDNYTALNNLALLFNALNQPAEAEEYALRATEVKNSGPAFTNAISAQVRQGAFERADSTLRRFETAAPNHPSALFLRGQWISAQRDFENAEAHFLGLRERFATRPGPLAGSTAFLAVLSEVKGKLAAAERYWRELVNFAVEDDQAADYVDRAMGIAWIDLGYRNAPTQALAKVDDALAHYPLETMSAIDRPYLDLAEFYAGAGLPDRAAPLVDEYEQEVDEALRRRARDDIYEARAAIAIAEGMFDEAISLLQAAKEEERCTICGDFDLARAYDRAGRVDSALVEYERLLSETFRNRVFRDAFALAPTYKRLGELYEERGEREKALENYNSFLELWSDADPELQDQVQDVRGRIARLVQEPRRP